MLTTIKTRAMRWLLAAAILTLLAAPPLAPPVQADPGCATGGSGCAA